MENQHRQIKDYRELNAKEIEDMNELKLQEEEVLQHIIELGQDPSYTGRWLAVARTHFQQGYMAAIRAVARPGNETQ